MNLKQQLSALGEKAILTFMQAYLTTMLLAESLDLSDSQQGWLAGIAALMTLALNALPLVPSNAPFGVLLAYGTLRTFIAGALSALLAAPQLDLSFENLQVVALGVLPAVMAFAKGVIANQLGKKGITAAGTPALLPAKLDPAA